LYHSAAAVALQPAHLAVEPHLLQLLFQLPLRHPYLRKSPDKPIDTIARDVTLLSAALWNYQL
jgi:hypothetical protein